MKWGQWKEDQRSVEPQSGVVFVICVSNELHVFKSNVHFSVFDFSEVLSLSISFFWQYTPLGSMALQF